MDNYLKYDFLELLIYDVHCIPKGRVIARQRIESVLKDGMGMYGGICFFGIGEEVITHDYFGASRKFGNHLLFPIPNTLRDVLPSARGNHKVGKVICALKSPEKTTEVTTPRTVAENQVTALADMGYSIRSSIELEFAIYHADTLKPFGHDKKWGNLRVLGNHEDIWFDFITELKAAGVHADTLQSEAGCGQYEMTLDVVEGLEGPDMASHFKTATHMFFEKRNLEATFMTKDQQDGFCHGFHFNFSLWTPDGVNVLLDANDPLKFSTVGRQWLAGLIAHSEALTALCCPTVNCYRRLHNPWVPSVSDWDTQSRNCCFRLKVEGKDNVYLENRLPSSACNPSLVMAGVVAAGMDGIKRKLSLEEAKSDQELPWNLESALKALEEDEYMVEALSKQFVSMYAYIKRTYEIEPLNACQGLSEAEQFEKEREKYFRQC